MQSGVPTASDHEVKAWCAVQCSTLLSHRLEIETSAQLITLLLSSEFVASDFFATMYIYSSIAIIALSLFTTTSIAQDANNTVFQVTAPRTGDTITSLGSTLNGVEVPIEWTVPSALADRPVMITLVQGTNLSSLSRIEQINCASSRNKKAGRFEDFCQSSRYSD